MSEESEETAVEQMPEAKEATSYVEQVLGDISAGRASVPSQEFKTPDVVSKKPNMEKIPAVYSIEKELMFSEYSDEVRTEDWTAPVIEDDEDEEEEEEEDPKQSPKEIQRKMEMLEGKFARQLFSLRYVYL